MKFYINLLKLFETINLILYFFLLVFKVSFNFTLDIIYKKSRIFKTSF